MQASQLGDKSSVSGLTEAQGAQSVENSQSFPESKEFNTWQTRLAQIYDAMDAESPGWSEDSRKLTVLSMLGSHDSGTYTMTSSKAANFAVTQTETLEGQLEVGVR